MWRKARRRSAGTAPATPGAFVAIDPDGAAAYWRGCELREDQRHVAGSGDHRVGPVGIALPGPARVRVDVRDDGESSLLAESPEVAEVPSLEPHDPAVQATRVEVVVRHEIDDTDPPVPAEAEKEGPALAASSPAPVAEHCEEPTPEKPGTRKVMPRGDHEANNLGNGVAHGQAQGIG